MKRVVGIFFILFLLASFVTPLAVFAQQSCGTPGANPNTCIPTGGLSNPQNQVPQNPSQTFGGLVPCGRSDSLSDQCQFCHLIELIQRVINFIIVFLAAPIATLLIAFAGIKLVTQADNESSRTEAKQLLKDILVGFLWILLAWSAVIAVLNILVKDKPQGAESNWFKIKCFDNYKPAEFDFRTAQGGGLSNVPVRPQDCTNCVALPSGIPTNGNACQGQGGGASCQISQNIIPNLSAMWGDSRASEIGLRASELWPPVVTHSDPCHRAGTCIDASLTVKTAENIKIAQEIARNSGMRAQYEVATNERLNELRNQGITDIIVVNRTPPISEHFSVYKQGYKN